VDAGYNISGMTYNQSNVVKSEYPRKCDRPAIDHTVSRLFSMPSSDFYCNKINPHPSNEYESKSGDYRMNIIPVIAALLIFLQVLYGDTLQQKLFGGDTLLTLSDAVQFAVDSSGSDSVPPSIPA
jgi:hypothetical protein